MFPVSVAAQLADMHPQTLRGYDRLGLVVPKRSRGRGRRYSLKDVAKLRHIQHLSQNEGINLEGIRRILALEEQIESLNASRRSCAGTGRHRRPPGSLLPTHRVRSTTDASRCAPAWPCPTTEQNPNEGTGPRGPVPSCFLKLVEPVVAKG